MYLECRLGLISYVCAINILVYGASIPHTADGHTGVELWGRPTGGQFDTFTHYQASVCHKSPIKLRGFSRGDLTIQRSYYLLACLLGSFFLSFFLSYVTKSGSHK